MPQTSVVVVETALHDQDAVRFDFVDQSVLLGDAPRPPACEIVFEWFRFAVGQRDDAGPPEALVLPFDPLSLYLFEIRRVDISVHQATERSNGSAKLLRLAHPIGSATGMSRLLISAVGGRKLIVKTADSGFRIDVRQGLAMISS
jgi:hypothetical protein